MASGALRTGAVSVPHTAIAVVGCLAVAGAVLAAEPPVAPSIPEVALFYGIGLFAQTVDGVREHRFVRCFSVLWVLAFVALLVVVAPYAVLVALFVDGAGLNYEFLALIVMGLVPPLVGGYELWQNWSQLTDAS